MIGERPTIDKWGKTKFISVHQGPLWILVNNKYLSWEEIQALEDEVKTLKSDLEGTRKEWQVEREYFGINIFSKGGSRDEWRKKSKDAESRLAKAQRTIPYMKSLGFVGQRCAYKLEKALGGGAQEIDSVELVHQVRNTRNFDIPDEDKTQEEKP